MGIAKAFRALRRFLSRFALRPALNRFRVTLHQQPWFVGMPVLNVGVFREDPVEFFDHYDSYCYWLAAKLETMKSGKKILDVGNLKLSNAVTALRHDVTALVLQDCGDRLSNVHYQLHDIRNALPFGDSTFDVFTSACSLNLAGLGRYGEEVSTETLPRFVSELDRVMKRKSQLMLSLAYGKRCVNFQNTFVFDTELIQTIFARWKLIDHLVDNSSGTVSLKSGKPRYTTDLSLDGYSLGEYRLIYLHFHR
jgi:hypothetical protein